ncbi:MAG: nuclear transport factor 2 family protein [Gemmatimonadaceae bacterium]
MTMTSKTEELLENERLFWNAMKEKDAKTAERMTDDGCIVVGAQGVSAIDGKMMGKLTQEGDWELKKFTFDEKTAQVRFLHDDVALVAYKVTERVVVDGETLTLDANDASVWVRRDGEWLCAMHTESVAGDPYGRDRRA